MTKHLPRWRQRWLVGLVSAVLVLGVLAAIPTAPPWLRAATGVAAFLCVLTLVVLIVWPNPREND